VFFSLASVCIGVFATMSGAQCVFQLVIFTQDLLLGSADNWLLLAGSL